MSTLTAVALVAVDAQGRPLSGVIAYLTSLSVEGGFLFGITNADGYVVFRAVPTPFTGVLQLAGAAQFYQQNVTVAGANVTLRVGPSTPNPQDILLPPCLPFRRPLVPPTREQVCLGQTTQQGLIVTTTEFGAMPWWGACWAWLSPDSRAQAAKQLLAHGDTVCLIGVPGGSPLYDEPNQFYSADKFPALSMTTDQVVALVKEALDLGFSAVWLFLGGDDGGTVGYPIAVQQAQTLGPALGDLTQAVLVIPGWDGTWYGYTPEQVASFAAVARSAGFVHVGIEHSTGHLLTGSGTADYAPGGTMTGYDCILGEFDSGVFDGTVWQVLGRMIDPYIWPPDQPAGSDQNPAPKYLSPGSPRGPYFYRVFEYGIYVWVRGEDPSTIQTWKSYFEGCGAAHVC